MNKEDLIKKCIARKKDAQYLLYQQYAAQMLGLCYRYTKSLEDAEDVLQEGFIKVFTNIHQYKNEGELGGWIRRIMINTAITYINKHKRYKKEMINDDVLLHAVSEDNPEIKLEVQDIIETIRQLPGNYQIVFNLIAIEGYKYNEVCDLLKQNINTIRSQYSRARAMLIQDLKNNEVLNIKNNAKGI